jgi:hypothetical protein
MAITITSDSATISTTEYFLASDSTTATYQTSKCAVQLFLDLSALTVTETYTLKWYEKVNAGTARQFVATTTFTGVQSPANYASLQYIVGEGWEVSLTRTAGTDRSISWSLRTIA